LNVGGAGTAEDMATDDIKRNDQAAGRRDGNAAGTWPGSGTTVEGPSESATSGILAGDHAGSAGSESTRAKQQEPEDREAEKPAADVEPPRRG
jgi:hypothetical protein